MMPRSAPGTRATSHRLRRPGHRPLVLARRQQRPPAPAPQQQQRRPRVDVGGQQPVQPLLRPHVRQPEQLRPWPPESGGPLRQRHHLERRGQRHLDVHSRHSALTGDPLGSGVVYVGGMDEGTGGLDTARTTSIARPTAARRGPTTPPARASRRRAAPPRLLRPVFSTFGDMGWGQPAAVGNTVVYDYAQGVAAATTATSTPSLDRPGHHLGRAGADEHRQHAGDAVAAVAGRHGDGAIFAAGTTSAKVGGVNCSRAPTPPATGATAACRDGAPPGRPTTWWAT